MVLAAGDLQRVVAFSDPLQLNEARLRDDICLLVEGGIPSKDSELVFAPTVNK